MNSDKKKTSFNTHYYHHLISDVRKREREFNVVAIDKIWHENLICCVRVCECESNLRTIRAGFVRSSHNMLMMTFMRIETSFFNYLNAKIFI